MTVTLSNGITITFQSAPAFALVPIERLGADVRSPQLSVPCAAAMLAPGPLFGEAP